MDIQTIGILASIVGLAILLFAKIVSKVAKKAGEVLVALGILSSVWFYATTRSTTQALIGVGILVTGLLIGFVTDGSILMVRIVGLLLFLAGAGVAFFL